MKTEPFRKTENQKQPVYYKFIDKQSEHTVVFIHGLFSTSSIFKSFLKHVKFNVILVELRGIVWSECEAPYRQNYVEDIRLILDKEKIKKNVTLVGYSMGCSIANAFAEKYSERINKAILLAPVNRTLKEIGKRNIIKKLIAGLGKGFFKKWGDYTGIQKGQSRWRIFSLFNFKLLQDAFGEVIFTKKCKIVILNGTMDTFFDPKDINLKLPNIVHERIENLDHFLFVRKKRTEMISKYLMAHLQAA